MRIQKIFLRLFLILLISAFVFSTAYAQDGNKSFLWKVQSNTSTAYILGSIHVMKDDIYPLDRKIENAFRESGSLVLEIDLNLDIGNALTELMQSAIYQNDDSLKNHLTPATYRLAAAAFKRSGLDIEMVEKFRPWFAAVTLETSELAKMGFDPELGIDKHFFNRAGNKKVLALETADFQMSLFNQFNDAEQENFLLATIAEVNTLGRELTRILNAWKTGDAAQMDYILAESGSKNPGTDQINEKILYQRNRNMALKVEGYLKTNETYFIVVGAAHLVGKKGIIELLRNRGYSVEQR